MLHKDTEVVPLHFDTSGRITGDYTNSVSYLSIAFFKRSGGDMIGLFKERDPEFIQELGPLMPDGITAKQVGQIRQWFEKWNIQPQVKLKRNLPFAPALFLGTLITIIFGGFPFDMHG